MSKIRKFNDQNYKRFDANFENDDTSYGINENWSDFPTNLQVFSTSVNSNDDNDDMDIEHNNSNENESDYNLNVNRLEKYKEYR